MKKVCSILGNPFTNDGRVYREAKSLAKGGYNVVVYATNPERNLPPLEKIDGFIVKRPAIKKYSPHFIPSRMLGFIKGLTKLVAEKADVYHANDRDTLLAGFLAKKITGAKLVYDSHEFWPDRRDSVKNRNKLMNFFKNFQESAFIKSADLVITVNDSIADALKELYKIRRPTVIKNFPESTDVKKYDLFRKEFKDIGTRKIVLYRGRWTREHGVEKLLEAAKLLSDGLVIVFLGNDELDGYLQDFVNKNNLKNKVFFHNIVPLKDVYAYTSSADIGIIPLLNVSLQNYYNLPNKIFEYINAGLAVATVDFPELHKVVDESKAGVVFNSEKPEEIARSLNKMIEDEDYLKKLQENAARSKSKFQWESEGEKLVEAYKKLAN